MRVSDKVIYPELSYQITGLLFELHNSLGRYCREKQYADSLELMLNEVRIPFKREEALPIEEIKNKFTNKADFVINNQLLLELKAKPFVTNEDYTQAHRYLEASGLKLGVIVNFRSKYLKPIRIIRSNS
jgi:GxxExxY protein